MSTEEQDITFTGGSAEDAEDFIFATQKRAFKKGKHRDNLWIADYVSVCFAKKALRWYETLDEETRNDWGLLKRAILDRYKDDSPSLSSIPTSAPAPNSSVRGTNPAAAPPTTKSGRIRVETESNSILGYIATTFYAEDWCSVSPNQSAAAIFNFNTSTRIITFQGNDEECLMARTYTRTWDLRKGSSDYGALIKNQGRTVDAKSGMPQNLESQADLWSELDGGKLVGRWKLKSGGFWELEGCSRAAELRVYLACDSQRFSQVYGAYERVNLYFEPLA